VLMTVITLPLITGPFGDGKMRV